MYRSLLTLVKGRFEICRQRVLHVGARAISSLLLRIQIHSKDVFEFVCVAAERRGLEYRCRMVEMEFLFLERRNAVFKEQH